MIAGSYSLGRGPFGFFDYTGKNSRTPAPPAPGAHFCQRASNENPGLRRPGSHKNVPIFLILGRLTPWAHVSDNHDLLLTSTG